MGITHNKGTEGFALVTAIATLLLLSIVALSLTARSRNSASTAADASVRARATLLADGFVRLAAWRLASMTAPHRRRTADANWNACRLDNLQMHYAITDVSGLIDLNTAPQSMIEDLLAGLGSTRSSARDLAEGIATFRRAGPLSAHDQGSPNSTHNITSPGNFQTVGELEQVNGINWDIYVKLRQMTTVHSRLIGVATNAAPPVVMHALRSNTALLNANFLPAQEAAYRIVAIAIIDGRGRAQREAIVQPSKHTASGFVIRDWIEAVGIEGRFNIPMDRLASCL